MFLLRALAVWLVITGIEATQGVLRTVFLAPYVGDFQARQIGVVTGSLLILTIAYLSVRWIRANSAQSLFLVGFVWLALTIIFELSLGYFVLGYSWNRLASDYDIRGGGLLPFGLVLMALSPLIAARLRDLRLSDNERLH